MTRAVLLICVGGSPEPVAFSIEYHRPARIIFFASRGSRGEIETKIRPLTSWRWADQEIVTTPNHEDLTTCMQSLFDGLPAALANLDASADELIVDHTGGTKPMSAAVVLATIYMRVAYSYVGGKVRTKDGLGQVLDGSEALLLTPNPWDLLAVDLRRTLARQFNRAHFAEAAATAEDAARRVGERLRPLFLSLREVCDGYARWHAFDFRGARTALRRGAPKLADWIRASRQSDLDAFIATLTRDVECLDALVQAFQDINQGVQPAPGAMAALVRDLVAQAERTCRLAHRPDDAVARLYSALEKLAKAALAAHGIDNSAARAERIPRPLREEFAARYTDRDGGTLRFGLEASYRLLDALGDPLGARYAANAGQLRQVLDIRNNSLLVHGWRPVDESVFDRLFALALAFLGIARAELPALPQMPEA